MRSVLRHALWLSAAAVAGPVFAQATPPALDVTLTPHATAGALDRLDVRMRIAAPAVAAGKTLLRMPVRIVSTPTAGYEAAAIQASDNKGPLTLHQVEEAPTPTGTYRHWDVDRATSGDVVARFGTGPRVVDASTRNGPLFDLRAQGGGLLGAGVYFMALPATETPYRISLHWELKDAPAGTRGIWSLGEGDRSTVAPAETLAFSYYAVGPVKSQPADGKGNFGVYWLQTPPFDVVTLAANIHRLYDYMSHFFHDDDGAYRVFARANPYVGGGGTSLAHSFMFAYGRGGETIPEGPQMLIAHEMAHTWPRLDGGDHADTAWYTEGTAEYYSTLLSLRSGAITLPKFLSVIDDHATGYYTNPHIALTNKQAGAIFWSDPDAQRVPYGRGFMYFAAVDAKMRAKYHGAKSLDDLVLEVLERQNKGERVGLDQWVAIVTREFGAVGRQDYDDMVAGKLIVPPANAFGPCFTPVATTMRPFDLGFDDMRLGTVSKLKPGSPAAVAGVQEGDAVVSLTPLDQLRDHPEREMLLTVRRGERRIQLHYLPRDAAVPGWHWARNAGVPDDACRL